jgi:hypothetical protein
MYPLRLAGLIVFFSVVAVLDWRKNGEKATRWREYLLALLCGLLGAAFGMIWDQGTLTISPDYFELGKGLDPKNGPMRLQALALGFKAGFFAGLVLGMLFLFANNPGRLKTLPYKRLIKRAIHPLLWVGPCALIGMVVIDYGDPMNRKKALLSILNEAQARAFLKVWGLHIGLYSGALIGLISGCLSIRKERSTLGLNLGQDEQDHDDCADAGPEIS